MAKFSELRRYLQDHRQDLLNAVPNPEPLEQELDNLAVYWKLYDKDDDAILLRETWDVIHKYPEARSLVEDAGVAPDPPQQVAKPAAIHSSTRATRPPNARTPDARTPQGDDRAYGGVSGGVSRRTLDKLASWDKKMAMGKEIVTGAIAVLIVLTTLAVAVAATFGMNNAEARSAAKDTLLFLNGLVGVVLGYYFGRVPGEVRADRAESEAKETRSELDQTRTGIRGVLETSGGTLERGTTSGGMNLTSQQVDRIREFLRD